MGYIGDVVTLLIGAVMTFLWVRGPLREDARTRKRRGVHFLVMGPALVFISLVSILEKATK